MHFLRIPLFIAQYITCTLLLKYFTFFFILCRCIFKYVDQLEDPGNKDFRFILNMTIKPLNLKCNSKEPVPERHLSVPPYIFEMTKYALFEQ